jgi:DNA-binding FadR family transcriptional regulator
MEDTRNEMTTWTDTVTGETRQVSAEEARRLTVNMRPAQELLRKYAPDTMPLYRRILDAVTVRDYEAASRAHSALVTLLTGGKSK